MRHCRHHAIFQPIAAILRFNVSQTAAVRHLRFLKIEISTADRVNIKFHGERSNGCRDRAIYLFSK